MKKTVCFIAQNANTCQFITSQLEHFLSEYIQVRPWCLHHTKTIPAECRQSDIFLASTRTILEEVAHQLPPDRPHLAAARTINIENLEKLLTIEPNIRVLVIGTSKETAMMAISILRSLGITYLDFIPCYTGGPAAPEDVKVAISTGLNHLVPPTVERIIDVGVKGIDISTYVELTQHLNVSKEVLNEISHYYIEALLAVSHKLHNIARVNESLKREIEVILNNVHEAIIAINKNGEIVVINPAAEQLLEVSGGTVTGKSIAAVLPHVDLNACLESGEEVLHEIKKINDSYLIINASPITNEGGEITGAVITTHPVVEVEELETKVRRTLHRQGHTAKHTFGEIIGDNPEFKKALDLAKKFAKTDLTVLLEGESGTGKELFAQAIHNHSARKKGPFVAVNFAALPENLVESELFGYEDGAFTGAKKGGKSGLFEQAHKGTIFLDEIGDVSQGVQKKLLRVLEEREVRRVGGSTITPVDVRVIAATNQNLREAVRKGDFRNDLYFRLCTLPIWIPPLRERNGDVLLLVQYFARRAGGFSLQVEPQLEEFLQQYGWPGNIRELQNAVRYFCSMSLGNSVVTMNDLPAYMTRDARTEGGEDAGVRAGGDERYEQIVREFEWKNVLGLVETILAEIRQSSVINQGLGRQTLIKRLAAQNKVYPEYKIRYWLKALADMGYIDAGVTRQGSKINRSGEQLLNYLLNRRAAVPHDRETV
jgi:transcriptional regulator with PAS, ATPase and Fis domain